MEVQLYIEGNRVELFKDETISIKSSVQDIADIGKTFTDYSQSFTLPASPNNNSIFSHWYNSEIEGGFDARTRKEAVIELNHTPFKVGKIQLNKATKKDGRIYSYNVTFYGNVVKLKDLFGDDLLTDLNLDAYIHDYDSDNVRDGLKGSTLLSGDVIYPLISSENVWEWGTANEQNIQFAAPSGAASPTRGLKWYELKPMLRLQRILDAIRIKYSISFTDDFFNSADFLKLYMWASRDKGLMNAFGEPTLLNFGGFSFFSTDVTVPYVRTIFTIAVTPDTGFEDVPYDIIRDVDGVQTRIPIESGVGISEWITAAEDLQVVKYYVSSTRALNFDAELTVDRYSTSGPPTTTDIYNTVTITTNGVVYFSDKTVNGVLQVGQLPKIKVEDFITGLIKMFNLVLVPKSSDSFTVQPLDDWYDNGEVKDFTKYVDLSTEIVEKPKLNKIINFNYQEPKTILQDNFNNTNNVFFSDLEFETEYDGNTLDVKLPFESLIMSRLSDSTGEVIDIRTGVCIDKELKPTKTKPIIFYKSGTSTALDDIGFRNDVGALISITNYNNVGQENGLANETITNTLNFGQEVSSITLNPVSDSLFSNYWQTYITSLYDDNRRVFKFTAYLPAGVLSLLELNDKLVINNRRYLINSFSADLTSGKTKLELLNDVVALDILPDTSNGLEYDLEAGLEG